MLQKALGVVRTNKNMLFPNFVTERIVLKNGGVKSHLDFPFERSETLGAQPIVLFS